jgi:hypothetical protein
MKSRVKKNRHDWRFFWILAGSRRCYVNLPLLHRLEVGMAKVKMAGKKNSAVHGEVQKSATTISTISAHWQALCRPGALFLPDCALSVVFTALPTLNDKNQTTC